MMCNSIFLNHINHGKEVLNENTNGLLREYFPKKQDLTEIKSSLIRDNTLILNQRTQMLELEIAF